ncbi:MAG: radical SAM protein [Lachnospiraceae bacterium]|nr:radical SAM protein [Lachnospiraceae bacterium]
MTRSESEKKKNENTGCSLCPRNCHTERRKGFCAGYERTDDVPTADLKGERDIVTLSRVALHYFEEPCISGTRGSGTVFFTGCNLRCVFCQNRTIALGHHGKEVSLERFTEDLLRLQEQGANNINLVTPSHYVPQIVRVLSALRQDERLRIPVVYNTASYEKVNAVRALEGLVDVYLPDLKYYSSELSKAYAAAPDYFEVASRAIREMVRQVTEGGGPSVFSEKEGVLATEKERHSASLRTPPKFCGIEEGILTRGIIIRHLVLPGHTEDSKKIISYLHAEYGNEVTLSIMNQYTPCISPEDPMAKKYPELTRRLTEREYDKVVDYAIQIGVENALIQEGPTALESFIPSFENLEGV